MDYNDYIDNSYDDHSYDVEDDAELYDLVVAGCHVAVTYIWNTLTNNLVEIFYQTSYKWLIDCLTDNKAKCHQMFRMKPHVFLQLCNVLQHRYGL